MPAHVSHVGLVGPVIGVGVNVGRLYAARGLGGPPRTCIALIDTGANRTVIGPEVQRLLRAQVVGSRSLVQPGRAPVELNEVEIFVKFEGHLAPHPWFEVSAVVRQPATPGVDVLIGQDILSQVVFTWDGPNARFRLIY